MAGKPVTREVLARIKERGGFGPILERRAEGDSINAIAKDYGCSRGTLMIILNSKKLAPKLVEAQKLGAHANVEKALELLEEIDPEGPSGQARIALANSKVKLLQWMAEKYDKEFFGPPKPGPTVNVNIADLWLNEVKKVQTSAKPKQISSGDIVDAEIIEDDNTNG